MLLRSNFSSFPQYFQYISNLGVKLRIHSVKGGCSINCFFLSSVNLICRTTDISKCFIESLGVRDNESRLYIANINMPSIFLIRLKFVEKCGTPITNSAKMESRSIQKKKPVNQEKKLGQYRKTLSSTNRTGRVFSILVEFVLIIMRADLGDIDTILR